MAHFAKIQNGVVVDVIVVGNADCGDKEFPESEPIGQAFIAACGISGVWKQTSYNTYIDRSGVSRHWNGQTPFRGCYASVGNIYDEVNDVFMPQGYTYDAVNDVFVAPVSETIDDDGE